MGQQHSIAPARMVPKGETKEHPKVFKLKKASMSEDSSLPTVPTEPELQCDQNALNDPSPPARGYYSRNISISAIC